MIPMHYDTFPPIETDAEAFKADVESKTSSKVVVLDPGETPQPPDVASHQESWPTGQSRR